MPVERQGVSRKFRGDPHEDHRNHHPQGQIPAGGHMRRNSATVRRASSAWAFRRGRALPVGAIAPVPADAAAIRSAPRTATMKGPGVPTPRHLVRR